MPRAAKNRNGLPSREGSKPRTFKITIDARQRKPCISQLEHDVRAAQQGWQLARELHHVSRIPRRRDGERGKGHMAEHWSSGGSGRRTQRVRVRRSVVVSGAEARVWEAASGQLRPDFDRCGLHERCVSAELRRAFAAQAVGVGETCETGVSASSLLRGRRRRGRWRAVEGGAGQRRLQAPARRVAARDQFGSGSFTGRRSRRPRRQTA